MPVAELRAGHPRRPHRGTLAAATEESSDGAMWSGRPGQLPAPAPL